MDDGASAYIPVYRCMMGRCNGEKLRSDVFGGLLKYSSCFPGIAQSREQSSFVLLLSTPRLP
jgi:hypothetical protein